MDSNNQQVMSKREKHLSRLRERYPDKKFEDDEEIYGQISDDYDQYEKDLNDYKSREQSISDMLSADPRSAQLLADMHNGTDPVIGLVRNFGVEIKDVLDDPEMQDKIAEANKEYVERVAKSKALDEEYDKNMSVTLETLRKFQEERGMTDEQTDELVDAMLTAVRDGVMGKFTPDTLQMFSNALNYDKDVTSAGEEGRIAGRNDRIVEQLRKREMGDGTSPLGGKNGVPNMKRHKTIFDEAREAV